jgi:hypothetical protein
MGSYLDLFQTIQFFFVYFPIAFLFLLNEEHRIKELYFFMENQERRNCTSKSFNFSEISIIILFIKN